MKDRQAMNTSILYKTPFGEQSVMAIYDTALTNWTVPYTTQMLPTRHGDTFVIASGNERAPAMILLHGAGGNSSMWAGDVGDFSRHFRVYAIDLIGEAGRSAPNRPDWNSPAFAEWLEDILDGLHLQQATLVGISQGAWAALKLAVSAPQRVANLVLIAPGGIVPDRASFLPRAILLMLLGKWGIRRMVRDLFGDQAVSKEVEDIVVTISSHFKPRVGVLPIFSDQELRRLTMSTLLVGGTKDIIRDMDKIRTRLQVLLPSLTVQMIPGAGHAVVNTGGYIMEFLMQQLPIHNP
jgi:pimeloyl-ACP methyl ester carboxylesterase